MGTKYDSKSTSGYNASPPADDGSATEANKIYWTTIKAKLADVLKTFTEEVNTALVAWADLGPEAKTSNYTTVIGDHLKTIECNGTFTVTLGTASSMTAGYTVSIKNVGTGVITIDGSGSELIDADLTKTITAGEGVTIQVNAAAGGWITLSKIDPQFKTPVTTSGTVTAYTATTGETAYTANKVYVVQIHGTNTPGAATINFDSIGAKSVKLGDGTDPYPGSMRTGCEARFTYDGTNMVLASPSSGVIPGGGLATGWFNSTHPADATAGTVTVAFVATEYSEPTSTPLIVYRFTVLRGGEYRIKFQLKNDPNAATATAEILRNGVQVATASSNSATYAEKSQDVSGWSTGDVLSVIIYNTTGAGTCVIRNFAIMESAPVSLPANTLNDPY